MASRRDAWRVDQSELIDAAKVMSASALARAVAATVGVSLVVLPHSVPAWG